jgi:hypothetical protein
VREKCAIDDVIKISYLSLFGVRNDPKLERTPIRLAEVAIVSKTNEQRGAMQRLIEAVQWLIGRKCTG